MVLWCSVDYRDYIFINGCRIMFSALLPNAVMTDVGTCTSNAVAGVIEYADITYSLLMVGPTELLVSSSVPA